MTRRRFNRESSQENLQAYRDSEYQTLITEGKNPKFAAFCADQRTEERRVYLGALFLRDVLGCDVSPGGSWVRSIY